MSQNYHLYTPEDHKVWEILYTRQMTLINKYASKEVVKGMEVCGFEAERIPNFDEVNERLKEATGWKIYVVPGLIDKKPFFEHLHKKEFPATTWLRKMSQLDYLEEPDMFHDVFGHIPLLSNKDFCNFLELLAGIALDHIDDDWIIELLGRLYWFTVEFGLIHENKKLKAFGAGILSSSGETEYCIESPIPARVLFGVTDTFNTKYHIDHFQDKYFVINSYRDLFESIPEIKKIIFCISEGLHI